MSTYTRLQALARARTVARYEVGMCLQFVRKQYGIPAGAPDAATAWALAKVRHHDARNPPPGVCAFYLGGSAGHGHVAITDERTGIVGTDAPTRGSIGTVPLDWPERNWGMRYVGWTEDLNGVALTADPRKRRRPSDIRAALKALRARLPNAGAVEARRIRNAKTRLRKINKR